MRRVRPAPVLLVLAALFGALTVSVAYGFALEYGDTGVGRWRNALDGLRWWGFGVAVVAVLALGAVLLSRGSLTVRSTAAVLVIGSLAGTAAGAAWGTEQKHARLPRTPNCTAELTSGPAVPVVRAAEASFRELHHPGPFTGGGSSGVDGCSSELVLSDGTDPRPSYRRSLAEHGWTVAGGSGEQLRAVQGRQAFELTRSGGTWTVWIGPADLEEPRRAEGEVGPRR
jgi:hypothetical protein